MKLAFVLIFLRKTNGKTEQYWIENDWREQRKV